MIVNKRWPFIGGSNLDPLPEVFFVFSGPGLSSEDSMVLSFNSFLQLSYILLIIDITYFMSITIIEQWAKLFLFRQLYSRFSFNSRVFKLEKGVMELVAATC